MGMVTRYGRLSTCPTVLHVNRIPTETLDAWSCTTVISLQSEAMERLERSPAYSVGLRRYARVRESRRTGSDERAHPLVISGLTRSRSPALILRAGPLSQVQRVSLVVPDDDFSRAPRGLVHALYHGDTL